MDIKYGIRDIKRAEKDVLAIYKLAEKRLGAGCFKWNVEELRNAFQVFRYAFKEWASDKEEGVVLKALMFDDFRSREVDIDIPKEEVEEQVIYCADPDLAVLLEQLLRTGGYEAESD
jgi:hypothetical protein